MMRRRIAGLVVASVLSVCASTLGAGEPPAVPREFRAAWIATVANIDWPSRPGLPIEDQQRELVRLLDLAVELKLNAIVLQVRPACDALYASELEPWSEYLTGKMGQSPEPEYDPLSFAVAEAHQRGLELHAWFNPYRATHPSMKGPLSDNHVSRTRPELVRQYGAYQWLDPGEPAAIDYNLAVIMDAVRRYDIDGVHFDDYFYPYPINEDGQQVDFPDEASWQKYLAGLGGQPPLERDDWRRENVNQLVARLYRAIKETKPWVKFGISPFGIYRPGQPEGIQGFDAYASLYADSRAWLQAPIVDYFSPQLYWPIDQPAQSYPVLLAWWHEQNVHGRHLWPGNFTSRVGDGSERAFTADEILRQIEVTRQQPGATGNIHFSIKALAADRGNLATQLREGLYAEPALVPESPWLANAAEPPAAPQLSWTGGPAKRMLVVRSAGGGSPWLWVVRRLQENGDWTTQIVPRHVKEVSFSSGDDGESSQSSTSRVKVSAVNRVGVEGPAAEIEGAPR